MTAKDFDLAKAALERAGWRCTGSKYPTWAPPGTSQQVDWCAYFERANPGKPEPDRFALNADSIGSRSFQHAIEP